MHTSHATTNKREKKNICTRQSTPSWNVKEANDIVASSTINIFTEKNENDF